MAKENTSPEERLLALIKGGNKKVDGSQLTVDSKKKNSGPSDPVSEVSAPARPDYASEIFKTYFSRNRLFDPEFLRSLNRYLVVAAAVLFAYFLFDVLFSRPYKDIEKAMSKISSAARPMEQPKKELSIRLKDYSYYSAQISGKKIFGAVSNEEGGGRVDIAGDIANNIGLVGIIPGSIPQAIIEDKKSQRTYYLTKGEAFDGFTLDEIGDGKVILEYNGKKIALFL